MENDKSYPTMIIPHGTEIGVNDHGQLSIRTPGNLVIQNTGVYSIIESTAGSVRIDPDVKVEAVSVQAAEACYIAGTLTAWRVAASKIILEKNAEAFVMLQESDALELDRSARLVGNFASEKELYLMLGRFNRQLRDLPEGLQPGEERVVPQLNGDVSRQRTSESSLPAEEDPFGTPTASAHASPSVATGEVAPEPAEDPWEQLGSLLDAERGRLRSSQAARDAVRRLGDLVARRQQGQLLQEADTLLAELEGLEDIEDTIRRLVRQLA